MTRRLILVGVVVAGLLGYGGYRLWSSRQPFEWTGTVEARNAEIGSRVGGRVAQVLVVEGDEVEAGQALIVLEPGDLLAQQLNAQAMLAQARAQLERLEKGALPEEVAQAKARAAAARASAQEATRGARAEEVAAALARFRGADSLAIRADKSLVRAKLLSGGGAINQSELEAAEAEAASTAAQRDAARDEYEALRKGNRQEVRVRAEEQAKEAAAGAKLLIEGARAEDLKAAHATVQAAEAKLSQVEVAIGELTIRAPRRARVEVLDLRPGDLLAPNAVAAVLLETDQLYVRIFIPETQIAHAAVGAAVRISVDGYPGETFGGSVKRINQQGEYTPRNLQTTDDRANQMFAARIEIDPDASERLRAGMSAVIEVAR